MKLHVSTNEVNVTPDIEELLDKKFTPKLEKFLNRYPDDTCKASLRLSTAERWGFTAICDLDIPGENIHAESKHKQLASAITTLANELTERLRKKKEKAQRN